MELHFKLTNENKEDYYILDWHTPFEGFRSNFLDIALFTNGKTDLLYQGPLVKRGNPSKSSYLPLQAGSALITTVVLNEAYNISKSGIYFVVLNTALMDVQKMNQEKDFHPAKLETGLNHIPLRANYAFFVVQSLHT